MGGISIWQLVIIAVIVVLLFGTKKLGSIGSDLGASIKGFKKAMSDDENKQEKSGQDADFTAKSIADKQDEAKKEEAKRHDSAGAAAFTRCGKNCRGLGACAPFAGNDRAERAGAGTEASGISGQPEKG